MPIPNIIAALTTAVWAHEPGQLQRFAGYLVSRHGDVPAAMALMNEPSVAAIEARRAVRDAALVSAVSGDGETLRASRTDYGLRVGSVAVISIGGVIAKHSGLVNGQCQERGTPLDAVAVAIDQAMADTGVGGVLLRIDSGGGYADGVPQFGDQLFGLRSHEKPVWAYADGMMASAAYWIASQAQRIEAVQDGTVGSIGTYMVAWDESAAVAQEGVKVHLIRAPKGEGVIKGEGAGGSAISERAVQNYQRWVDETQAIFEASVARGRKLSAEAVRALATGEFWMAKQAAERGLVDAVRPIGETIREMNKRFPARGGAMNGVAARGLGSSVVGGVGITVGTAAAVGSETARATTEEAATGGGSQPMRKLMGVLSGALLVPVTADQGAECGGVTGGGGGGGGGSGGGGAVSADSIKIEAVKAERDRVAAIKAEAAPFLATDGVAPLVEKAVSEGTGVEAFRKALLDTVAKAAAPTGIRGSLAVSVGSTGGERLTSVATVSLFERGCTGTAMMIRQGGDKANRVARVLGYADANEYIKLSNEARNSNLQRPLASLAEMVLEAGGVSVRSMSREQVFASASQSTGDFANILSSLASKAMLAGYSEQDTTWRTWCRVGSASDFKAASRLRLSEAADLKLVNEDGKLDASVLNEKAFSVQVKTHGMTFGLTRQAFLNDEVGTFTSLPQLFGSAAARKPEELAYARLTNTGNLADGNPLFHASRNNLESAAALSMASLVSACNKLSLQKGFGENAAPLNILPRFVLTGIPIRFVARDLYTAKTDPTSGQANANRPNQVAGMCEAIGSPRIASGTAFYVLGDPAVAPVIEVTFLNGVETPQIVRKQYQGVSEGPQWEILYDVDANVVGTEGAVYNPGA